METRLKMLRVVTLALVLAGAPAAANAATILVSPTSATSVDVLVNGLAPNEFLGAFDFDVIFDPSLTGPVLTTDPGSVFYDGITGFEFVTPGVNMFTVNGALDTECQPGGAVFPACVASQLGTDWVLATLTFTGGDATTFPPVLANTGLQVEAIPAPEPASMLLLALGFVGARVARRRVS